MTPDTTLSGTETPRTPANLLGLDYHAEAAGFRAVPGAICDAHAHINGARASEVWLRAADDYGVREVITQTRLSEAPAVREVLGDRAVFVAIPDYMAEDRAHAFTDGFVDAMKTWRDEYGARMVKFWMAPRLRDLVPGSGLEGLETLDSPLRRKQMDVAADLGLMFMTHTGDPDTWFQTKYADASVYGTKAQQYEPLERAIRDYAPMPWLLAHMSGWPEDLDFLDGMLERHPNVVVDTSATKWMVRELSKHSTQRLLAFLERWRGRVLFGSDIVATDEHLGASEKRDPGDKRPDFGKQASSEAEAYDLYASRYWALRTMFEGTYQGPSPIADPDLALVDPERFDEMSSPELKGHGLPDALMDVVHRGAAEKSILGWYRDGVWNAGG